MGKSANRILGFDIARALAILGMVIVNYKISMDAEGNGPDWLVTLTGILEGRASAIFVILAGIGISLSTKKARLKSTSSKEYRKMIWRRSLFLFVLGILLMLMQWSADILHYYAFYMFIASFFIVASSRKLILTVVIIVLTSQTFQLLFNYEYGWNTTFEKYEMFWTWKGFISNLFFNGYHPIFPWVAFLLFGMWLGRVDLQNPRIQQKFMTVSLITLFLTEATSYVFIKLSESAVGIEVALYLFDTKPMPPSLLYMISSTSSAIILILLCVMISEKWRSSTVTQALVYTGQLALTLYVGHFLVLAVFFMFGGLAENTLTFAVTIAVIFFILSTFLSTWWRKAFKRGPIEALMRKISG
ncbi:hypothetical protein FIU87_19465 [Bacillus sp. THAF10]|uniref:DUF418 domain-containing protein n=1 Tax=Bacillus sp. THAF10 TaxID=2587848 RepID=UPI00126959D9|nr:DUF418 domain-containing protein [Bacillus sp. THAF10]QFT90829.1 hypothetical protein FIU87_19465 [Bacillus sp. THAF10]